MPVPSREVMDRKLASLRRFLTDLREYAGLDGEGRRREHCGLSRDLRHAGFFETEQHKRIFRQLKTAIPKGYLIAVSGIVGSGKTTTLRRLQEMLRKENKVIVSKSLSVQKSRTTLKTLICALFYDVSGDKDYRVATVGEKRERDLQELIRSAKNTVALFIDEARDLHHLTLTGLKRLVGRAVPDQALGGAPVHERQPGFGPNARVDRGDARSGFADLADDGS